MKSRSRDGLAAKGLLATVKRLESIKADVSSVGLSSEPCPLPEEKPEGTSVSPFFLCRGRVRNASLPGLGQRLPGSYHSLPLSHRHSYLDQHGGGVDVCSVFTLLADAVAPKQTMGDRSRTRSKIYERLNNPELRCKTG